MYINITTTETGNNKGSSGGLVQYLEKENRQQLEPGTPLQPEYWFNGQQSNIKPHEVRRKIDNNVSKLSKSDSKFFLVNISPSKKEIAHLQNLYGREGAKEKLKTYAEKVMDEYARNFKRPGIQDNRDLLWFGKLENHRYYSYRDVEVKQGLKKRGERKEGEQMHVQVIVSRKDISDKIKLSPQNTSRGRNARHSKKMGQFDRLAFKQSGETVFDQLFGFKRSLKETLAYSNAQKNGTVQQKAQLHLLKKIQDSQPKPMQLVKEIAGKSLGILMAPSFDTKDNLAPIEGKKRKEEKRTQQEYQGLSR